MQCMSLLGVYSCTYNIAAAFRLCFLARTIAKLQRASCRTAHNQKDMHTLSIGFTTRYKQSACQDSNSHVAVVQSAEEVR